MLRMDTNVIMDYEFYTGEMLKSMDTNVMMDYEFDIGWNVEKDGYECYDGLSI